MDRTTPAPIRLTTCRLDRPLTPAEADELLGALPPGTDALLEDEDAVLLLGPDTGEAPPVPDVLAERLRDWPSVSRLSPAARALLPA